MYVAIFLLFIQTYVGVFNFPLGVVIKIEPISLSLIINLNLNREFLLFIRQESKVIIYNLLFTYVASLTEESLSELSKQELIAMMLKIQWNKME